MADHNTTLPRQCCIQATINNHRVPNQHRHNRVVYAGGEANQARTAAAGPSTPRHRRESSSVPSDGEEWITEMEAEEVAEWRDAVGRRRVWEERRRTGMRTWPS